MHEIGALLAASQAVELGWNALYLGASLPADEIAAAAAARGAAGVLLSLVYPQGDPATAEELRRLRQLLPPEVFVLAGGRAARSFEPALAGIGALVAADMDELTRILGEQQPA
jgi:methylmalonyl-CoA mutase cobalamin-binding subunit